MSDNENEQECANPLFLKWVREWYHDACKRNTQTQFTLKKALTSLQRYPLRLENPQDAVQLQGIGQTIADRLAKKLARWQKDNGIAPPEQPQEPESEPVGASDCGTRDASATRGQRAPRIYVPRYRTGAFALLIGLYKTYCLYGPDYYIPKSELIPLCEQYSDTPFHVAGSAGGQRSGGHTQHTAWSGIKTLETKSLVERQGRIRFCLTDEGLVISKKVVELLRSRGEVPDDDNQVFTEYEIGKQQQQQSDGGFELLQSEHGPYPLDTISEHSLSSFCERDQRATAGLPLLMAGAHTPRRSNSAISRASSGASFSRQASISGAAEVELSDLARYPKDEYDIILVVDNREVHSSADRALIQRELEGQDVQIEIRPLTIGDYLWIARTKKTGNYRHLPDIVLDYVVERKRMDDLCASIRDGRYQEQHSRIHGTGFTNVFYIVEGNDPDAVSRLGELAVNSALSRIQIHNGFHLKRPPSFEATLRLLRQLTRGLQSTLGDVHAIPDSLVSHKEFAKVKKNLNSRFPQIHLALTFDAYDVVSNKSATLTVGEIYLRMLRTLRGISADKALTIGRQYQTSKQLIEALEADENGKKVLSELLVDGSCRKLGPVLGKRVADFWTSRAFS
ncbi:Crossover junction endonuclease mus81 [Coemansia sp. RSA 1813]|nr:Crossover junction endonuclease mus81 [Coemansia sp. RSA 1646]KAJ1766773.1 Crossover junction endonuclease mus81 [Coemansia sp. RSA 1843]KAJ2091818.1 Crossover junction endonuclease mus81 [Coemansia sp. RSA 986]KAJ2215856.1 Crossover junction endonuclease mus81 [Coemansia sp. RSA 487]KAJ2571786.1 Crossover junction endonuclease mus81 [Coemansia sp. RSA 1813]